MTSLTATGPLTRFALRRDRMLVPVWLVVLVGVVYVSAAATPGLYPTEAERVATAEGWNATPSVVALYGPLMDTGSLGELAMTKMTVLYAVFAAVMAMVLVRRHLRTEEESGRHELVGATVVGRGAPLAAALAEVVLVALLLGASCAVACVAGGLPWRGSVLFGASWTGMVVVFGAATALACQVSASSRTCAMVASALIAGAYATRLVGDTTQTWVSWLSPFGWNTRLLAWADTPRWWVLGLYVLLAALLALAAGLLTARRDAGAGLVAPRPGPARGASSLGSAGALVRRSSRGTFWSWTVATAALGVLFGTITPGITDLLDTPVAQEMVTKLGGAGALEDAMVSAILGVVAVVVTCFGVAVLVHAANDEHDGRTEQVLGAGTSRTRQFLAVALVALGGTTVLVLVSGAAMALGYTLVAGDAHSFVRVLGAGAAQAPAVWVVVALTLLASAVRSRWAWAGWALVTVFLLLGEFGDLLELPAWVQDVSPYAHTPRVPAEAMGWPPVLVLSALAAALTGLAWFLHGRRDIG